MVSESTHNGKRTSKLYDIKQIPEQMNQEALKYLLVIHAFGECYTTSGVHKKAKNYVLKLVTKSKKLQRPLPYPYVYIINKIILNDIK